jgi:transposase
MIVLGVDMHKGSHTITGVAAATGEMLGDKTSSVGARGFDRVLQWARAVGVERVWALEGCRHVSGSLERFLIARGERVVRVPTRLMANSRRASRERGKSDRIDALAVARAALAEGIQTLPTAELAGPELDIRLLVDHCGAGRARFGQAKQQRDVRDPRRFQLVPSRRPTPRATTLACSAKGGARRGCAM